MRPERLYLADIVEAADLIASFIEGQSEEAFVADRRLSSAVLYQLIIIGEAAGNISDDLRGDILWCRGAKPLACGTSRHTAISR